MENIKELQEGTYDIDTIVDSVSVKNGTAKSGRPYQVLLIKFTNYDFEVGVPMFGADASMLKVLLTENAKSTKVKPE